MDARMITYTGIGRYIQNLIAHLPQVDGSCRITAITGAKTIELPVYANLDIQATARDIPVYSLIKEQFLLPAEMNRSAPDIFHYPSFNMPLRNPKPAVVTIHDLVYYLDPASCSRLRHYYARIMFPLVARSARRIIAGSEHTKVDIVNHLKVNPAKVTVIHHGVSAVYKPVADERLIDEVRLRYKIVGDYILYVGSHHPRKNLKRLIEAFALIKAEGLRLVITGAIEPRRGELYDTPSRLGMARRVIFTGSVSEKDLPALYSGALVFVMPSIYEGFGLPPLEAMACGTPVASSNATSLPEVTGDAALTFDPLDTTAISACMDRLISDTGLRERLRELGLARAKKFSWRRTAEQTLGVYLAALAD